MVTRGEVSDVRGPFPGAQAQDGLDVRDVLLHRWSHRVCEVREVSNSHVVQVQQTPSSCQTGRACEVRDLSNPHVTHVGRTAVKRGARQERQVPGASVPGLGRTAMRATCQKCRWGTWGKEFIRKRAGFCTCV